MNGLHLAAAFHIADLRFLAERLLILLLLAQGCLSRAFAFFGVLSFTLGGARRVALCRWGAGVEATDLPRSGEGDRRRLRCISPGGEGGEGEGFEAGSSRDDGCEASGRGEGDRDVPGVRASASQLSPPKAAS
ncbi:hypothetical protein C8Q78DRAFT_496768 [Trametes maxima]|nr:hypothetical protein C8Q78DRAFT_496768 [Trametes maxima]